MNIEHEKLKKICYKIGYKTHESIEYFYPIFIYKGEKRKDGTFIKVDVRQIIFTQEFMDKFEYFLGTTDYPKKILDTYNESGYLSVFRNDLIGYNNLNNPVDYLYNLIK